MMVRVEGKCIINLVFGSATFICLFYLLGNWHSDNARCTCIGYIPEGLKLDKI